ncbi:MAG: ribosome recycling factor [Patescibacteria group bacterium]
MDPSISDFKNLSQKTVAALKEDLKAIRTGRANSAMFEGVEVEAYGGSTVLRLKELATMTTEGASTIVIVPFDPSTSNDIERAIMKSPLGVTPQNEGTKIFIRIPPMSEEQREKMVKIVSQKIEERKGMIRNQRDEARKKIKKMIEAKEITEDDKTQMEKEIDSINTSLMNDIDAIKSAKEEDIRQV